MEHNFVAAFERDESLKLITQFSLSGDFSTIIFEDKNGLEIARYDADATSPFLSPNLPLFMGVIPSAIRWINTDSTSLIMEQPPQFYSGFSRRDFQPFTVPYPWIVTLICFNEPVPIHTRRKYVNNINVTIEQYGRTAPIRSEEDSLFLVPLPPPPNVHQEWVLRSINRYLEILQTSRLIACDPVDIDSAHLPRNFPGEKTDYFQWAQAHNLEDTLDWDWRDSGKTVHDLMKASAFDMPSSVNTAQYLYMKIRGFI